MPSCDICPNCDGTGVRDFLSGAKCYHCNGTGIIEDSDDDDEEFDEDEYWALLHELEWGMEWKTRSLTLITHHTGSLNGALEDAREARFEFGQTPRSPRD